ncbi:MAG: hypothetical protein ACK55I_03220, partial [bacterium]
MEQIVVSAMIEAFGQGRLLADEDLERARDQTVPLSVTMEERVFQLREWAASRCRRATLDSRVSQMIEDERREAELNAVLEPDDRPLEPWEDLAEHG